MLKTAHEFAAQLAALCNGDLDEMRRNTFEGAKVYRNVPNKFWVDVYDLLPVASTRHLAGDYVAIGYPFKEGEAQ